MTISVGSGSFLGLDNTSLESSYHHGNVVFSIEGKLNIISSGLKDEGVTGRLVGDRLTLSSLQPQRSAAHPQSGRVSRVSRVTD